jgi:hypothetical protein
MSGFKASGFTIHGFTTSTEALARMEPICPQCGQQGRIKLV